MRRSDITNNNGKPTPGTFKRSSNHDGMQAESSLYCIPCRCWNLYYSGEHTLHKTSMRPKGDVNLIPIVNPPHCLQESPCQNKCQAHWQANHGNTNESPSCDFCSPHHPDQSPVVTSQSIYPQWCTGAPCLRLLTVTQSIVRIHVWTNLTRCTMLQYAISARACDEFEQNAQVVWYISK